MTTFIESPQQASRWCARQRKIGHKIGYVPTMGALHDGHLSLVKRSVEKNTLTCVSIFVNPLQFNNPDDLKNYPRPMQADLEKLERAQCDMVFTGSREDFFPDQVDFSPTASSTELPCMQGLEADHRPGHLEGVKAIVEKLFDTVGECRAYFGEKDFQQTLLVREIAKRHGKVEIVVCPTVREPSGLAMSSRNQRLSPEAFTLAASLHQALLKAQAAWRDGERNPQVLEQLMTNWLDQPGITLEYATVRDPEKWTAEIPESLPDSAQALIAVQIGGVRLIDNLALG
jgi:pantoate--beta-alanine ligase